MNIEVQTDIIAVVLGSILPPTCTFSVYPSSYSISTYQIALDTEVELDRLNIGVFFNFSEDSNIFMSSTKLEFVHRGRPRSTKVNIAKHSQQLDQDDIARPQ